MNKNKLIYHLTTLVVSFFIVSNQSLYSSIPHTLNHPDSVYAFTYHHGDPHSGIRIAYSVDRFYWLPIGNDYSYVKSDFGAWGANKKMFSPSVIFDNGTWYAVWSVNDTASQFATTKSSDFWVWKPQDYPYLQNKDKCFDPILIKSAGVFEVIYRNQEGNYYKVQSNDFIKWSTPIQSVKDEYIRLSPQTEITIGGIKYKGNIHKVPYKIIENLLLRTQDSENRNELYNENCREDNTRFNNIDSISAVLNISEISKPISTNLIGIFFEDINYSADGGLYAELIQNRDFEYNHTDRGDWNAKSFWELKGNASFNISEEDPIHINNKHYAVINCNGEESILSNNGFDGIVLNKGEKYEFSFWGKSLSRGSYSVVVRLSEGDKVLAEHRFKISSPNWKQQKCVLTSLSDSHNATLSLVIKGKGELGLDFISLFPQNTFKSRPNGLRQDLAQILADLHPKFIRFPGGCVTHGNGLNNMYRWKETIGPLWERKSQFNIWGYHQTKGLGFYEYFQFCEDIGAEPLPVLPAGVCCQNSSIGGDGQQGGLPMEEMEAYTQELLDLIEWANGDAATSKWAQKRAAAGHPAPFNLKMIGIGNEDLISDIFKERFNYINRAIKQKYPDIQVVGTVGPFYEGSDYEYGWQLAKDEKIDIVDEHYYVSPGWYIHNSNYYDKYDRNGTKVYLGEWASRANHLENALAEALHITNLERNGDVVVMSSYAPLLAKHGHTQWNPDLIYFNNTDVFPTVNYYVQKMSGNNNGNKYIYSTLNLRATSNGHLINNDDLKKRISQSVVIDESTGDLIIKLVNMTPFASPINIILGNYDNYENASVTVLSGQPYDKDIKPEEYRINKSDLSTLKLKAYSFTVLRLSK